MTLWNGGRRPVSALEGWRVVLFSALMAVAPAQASAMVVFFDDFDGGQTLGAGVGVSLTTFGASVQSVQGYSADGFSGNMLASYGNVTGQNLNSATLVLSNLPTHTHVDIRGLLAVIASWDSDSPPAGPDFMRFRVDGADVFVDTYNNASGSNNNQQGLAQLAGPGVDRGFNDVGNFNDAAYRLDGTNFTGIAHTSSTLTLEILANGTGWQGGVTQGFDEGWGIENLAVSVFDNSVPAAAPPTLALLIPFVWMFWRGRA